MDMVFANRLKEVRERSGMKRKEVAEKLGITMQAYTCYEYGRREPRLNYPKSSIYQLMCYVRLIP